MSQMDFVNDMKDNYLISRCTEEESFTYNMIIENDIPFFLPSEKRYLNGELFVYYKVTGKQTVRTIWTEKVISKEDFERIVESLRSAILNAEEFFLPVAGICLLPDKMFWNYEKKRVEFVYLPEQKGELEWDSLLEFLMDRMDYNNEQLVDAIQQFYKVVEDKQMMLDDFFIKEDSAPYIVEQNDVIDNVKLQEVEEIIELEKNLIDSTEDTTENPGKKARLVYLVGAGGGLLSLLTVLYKMYCSGELFFPGVVVMVASIVIFMAVKICSDNRKSMLEEKQWKESRRAELELEREQHKHNAGTWYEDNIGTKYVSDCEKTICVDLNEQEKRKLYGMQTYRKYKIDLSSLPCTIGKDKSLVTHVIPERSISRMHVRFYEEEGRVWIQDLNSTNGTYQNGVRLRPNQKATLETEDEIILGEVGFVYL